MACACQPSRLLLPTSISASSRKQTTTRIPRLLSNTGKDPPKSVESWTRLRRKGYRRKGVRVGTGLRPVQAKRSSAAAHSNSGFALPHHGGMLRPNLVKHANLSRLPVRILVHPQILLRHLVDVRGSAVFGNLNHGAADLQVAIGIV